MNNERYQKASDDYQVHVERVKRTISQYQEGNLLLSQFLDEMNTYYSVYRDDIRDTVIEMMKAENEEE